MALLTATASAIAISNSSCLLQSLNHSSFSHRIGFPKSPNFSSSCNFLYIQSHQKLENFSGGKNNKQKQSSSHQNASPSFAELKALNVHQSHKIPTSKTPPKHRQTTHKNEGKRQTRTNNHKNPNPENEDSKLYNRASSEPSLSGGEILMALQRAYQEKAKERSRKSKQKAASTTKREKGFQEREKRRVIGEVRPITVKPQWSAKIESLEKRLQELKEREDIT